MLLAQVCASYRICIKSYFVQWILFRTDVPMTELTYTVEHFNEKKTSNYVLADDIFIIKWLKMSQDNVSDQANV